MGKDNIVTGLDIGTSNIRIVVASLKDKEGKPKIIGKGEVPSSGIRKGIIIDIDEVVENIKKAVDQAELSSGVPINHAYVSIGGDHISIRENKGLVAVSRADQEVSEEDISRVIESASAISLPPNREIIHIIPRSFKLDNEENIQDPIGMTGARLEVNALIIDGLSPYIKNLTKCLLSANIKIDGLLLNSLAAAQAVLSKRQKELGVLVLDLGGGSSGMAVYEEGKLLYAHVLPVGSDHITNDIAIGLRTTIDIAEKVKLQYGSALASDIKKKENHIKILEQNIEEENIDLSELDQNEEDTVKKKEVAKIIEARVQELFDLVNKELKKINKQRLLPAGVILVGGGALMPKIVDLAKKELGLPAEIGSSTSHVESVMNKENDPSFATAIGLILSATKMKKRGKQELAFLSDIPAASVTIGKIKKWFRSLLP